MHEGDWRAARRQRGQDCLRKKKGEGVENLKCVLYNGRAFYLQGVLKKNPKEYGLDRQRVVIDDKGDIETTVCNGGFLDTMSPLGFDMKL